MSASLTARTEEKQKVRTTQGTQRSLPLAAAGVSFADNDYLGLSRHPRVMEAAIRSIREGGTGARAARHLAGPCPDHSRLEQALAAWKGTEGALVFASGYQTPLGVIPSLVGPKDTVLLEKNAHSCLFDGARLSAARLRVFVRNDAASLAEALASTKKLNPEGNVLIVAESLHSMDGDFLELHALVDLKHQFGAWLLLDEAHANGVIGPAGAGWAAELKLTESIDIHLGTLGKALGSAGGFVAARLSVIDHLLNEARTFLFGTAPAPAAMAAAAEALAIVCQEEGRRLRETLQKNIGLFCRETASHAHGAIQPRLLKSNEEALAARDFLRSLELEVAAIRPPTVPAGTARLRVSLSARHSAEDIQRLTDALARFPAA